MFNIKETYVNKTESYTIGDSEFYEPFTQDIGELFKSLQNEFGRCTSKMYYEPKEGDSYQIGWVFESKQQYEDSNNTYIREVWVELDDPNYFE